MLADMLARSALIVAMSIAACSARGANDIVFDLPALPALQRYSALLEQPGYIAVALESNGLSPSLASKLKIAERGRSAEIRNAVIRFVEKKGSVYTYQATYLVGLGNAGISFPVSVDIGGLPKGAVTLSASPPLAGVIPDDVLAKVRIKIALLANEGSQHRMVEYLDASSKDGNLVEGILLDGYNRATGPQRQADAGDALPLSDEWLLLLTLAIWLVAVPGFLIARRMRQRRDKPV